MNPDFPLSRRHFLGAALAAPWCRRLACLDPAGEPPAPRPRCEPPPRTDKAPKKIAVVTTAYYYLSHAYHVCGRFLNGYLRGGKMHYPDFGIAGMYVEQQAPNDLSKEHSHKHGFPLYPDIGSALTLGGDKLAVDGVLLIGEHGDYPMNEKMQKLYPRYEYFQKIVEVFQKSGRTVPVFCDKHLSYDRKMAREMADTARRVGVPLMAGSSLPITWRRPELELPLGVQLEGAIVASRGEMEIYGIHALEALQCMVERRAASGGRQPPDGALHQGVTAVRCLEGDAVWKAGDDGLWSWDLLDAALARSPSLNVGDIRDNCRQFVPPPNRPTFPTGPLAFLVEYRDGFKAAALLLNGHVDDTTFAAKLADEKKPASTLFDLPAPPGAGFLQALAIKIEDFLATGKPSQPLERTLLTGGILDVALEARISKVKRLVPSDLDIAYEAPKESGFLRGGYNDTP
ncbi:MAG TPA: hypothetical protein VMS17_33450 [Gemmataceae bacterium]|nr:hypothetical protein [Gemmataceae bacterium]